MAHAANITHPPKKFFMILLPPLNPYPVGNGTGKNLLYPILSDAICGNGTAMGHAGIDNLPSGHGADRINGIACYGAAVFSGPQNAMGIGINPKTAGSFRVRF
jgi:hypothetical protein